jgi:hypothetical protein
MWKKVYFVTTALALGGLSCAPTVNAYARPKGLGISGVCENIGKDTFVTVYVMPTRDGSPWRLDFEGQAPEGLSVDCTDSHAILRWKIGQEHRFFGGIKPYQFRLTSGDTHYQAAVHFETMTQGLGAAGMFRALVALR